MPGAFDLVKLQNCGTKNNTFFKAGLCPVWNNINISSLKSIFILLDINNLKQKLNLFFAIFNIFFTGFAKIATLHQLKSNKGLISAIFANIAA